VCPIVISYFVNFKELRCSFQPWCTQICTLLGY